MKIYKFNENKLDFEFTVSVAEFLVNFIESLEINNIKNVNSEDVTEIVFIIDQYDYSVYEITCKFFDLLKELNIQWYFSSSRSDVYIYCHINKMDKEKFDLLSQTNKYNL